MNQDFATPEKMRDIKAALEAGCAIGKPKHVKVPEGELPNGVRGYTPMAVIPDGWTATPFTAVEDKPKLKASPLFTTAESFISYIKRFSTAPTVVFCDQGRRTMLSVLDYHDIETPAHCRHTAKLVLSFSEQWAAWYGSNKKKMPQVEFAEFLEENELDVVGPDAATLREICLNLHGTQSVKWGSAHRTKDGSTSFSYVEEAKTGSDQPKKGEVEVPDFFDLAIPIFQGDEPIKLKARLRYRIGRGEVSFFFVLDRPTDKIMNRFGELRDKVAEETGRYVYDGSKE